ncbi:hypothetical protein DACRYDRAFT_105290 [Dacryopinax primogenitus]|uniref:Uncharacterized protein n=1 Tax=Dacryopinax primogenitus (strain DJM 731) TaxID=1858805 RepID=M5G7W6_DACPD|nr:uncharacterized protein DACRYDRAFT_105290 [Dacryopinax primogenitus]EJU04225.1 hypothetical protein DACRYDRAFT_105290 [Dacryopinax primogenitus]
MLQDLCHCAMTAGDSTQWLHHIGLPLPIYWVACAARDKAIADLRVTDSTSGIYASLKATLLNMANKRWGEKAKVLKGKGQGVIEHYEWVFTLAPLEEQGALFPCFQYRLPSSEEEAYGVKPAGRVEAWKSIKEDLKTDHARAFYALLLLEDRLQEFDSGPHPDTPPLSDDEKLQLRATAAGLNASDDDDDY